MSDEESQEEDEGDENEEEYREVDPMQVIEERLTLLEAWLHEDPYQDDVNHKREEYLSLMEELEILGKKMRKTDKMLAVPNQPNLAKLERKREQYEREVTDIVLYAEQDAFFDLDGENGEAAMVAYMKANSLLGKPLETLAEMPGFEDSKAWNDSFGAMDNRSIREEASPKPSSKRALKGSNNNKRNNKNNDDDDDPNNSSTAQLDLSQPHNITILKKKLKKAKQLLENTTSEKERKRLFKKISEYKEALSTAELQSQADEDETTEGDDHSHASEESIDPPIRSPVKVFSKPNPKTTTPTKTNHASSTNNSAKKNNHSSTRQKEEEDDDDDTEDDDEATYILYKRKLSKATKLAKAATTHKERHKFEKKIRQYLGTLQRFDAWKNDQLAYGYDAGHSVEEESHESEWMEQQAAADEQRLAHEELQQQESQRRRTHAKTMLDSRKLNQDPSPKDSAKKKTPPATSSSAGAAARKVVSSEDDSLDLEKYIDDERKQAKILRKKLAKVEGMIDDKLKQEGDEARYTKEFRKLQKKRKQYLTELGEDHASLANLSFGGSTMSMSANPYDSGSCEMSSNSFRIEDMMEEDDEEERHYQKARQARLQEQERMRQERLAAERGKKASSTNDEEELLRKKLKKVGKMLMNTEKGSKEYSKLMKKKKEYLELLGEAG